MKYRVAVVACPWKSFAPYKFLSDVLLILEPICEQITFINGNTKNIKIDNKKINIIDIGISMHYASDKKPLFYSILLWTIKCLYIEIIESIYIIKERKKFDIVIFYQAYPNFLLQLITSKILGKKTVEIATRSGKQHSKILKLLERVYIFLLDGISPESNYILETLVPYRYRNKILPEGARFIDISKYRIIKNYSERRNIVGYIGRLSKEKGLDELTKSILILAKKGENVEFIIGGSGILLKWLENEASSINNSYETKVKVTGFIEEEMLPLYLNEFKLLILPTKHDEGLPTVILEAMACGTPVLSSSAGAIPSIINDEVTGFILEKMDPESIANSIINALNHNNLNLISVNANKMVATNFSYNCAVERWGKILSQVIIK